MTINIVVTRQYNNDLTQVNYGFYYFVDSNKLKLNHYEEIHRESTRHKFKLDKYRNTWWDQGNNRDATTRRADIIVPDDVKAEAIQQIIDLVTSATME